MKIGDAEYDALVARLGHKHIQMTEKECADEIAKVTDGAVSTFAREHVGVEKVDREKTVTEIAKTLEPTIGQVLEHEVKKRRGRPPGSRNRPKP